MWSRVLLRFALFAFCAVFVQATPYQTRFNVSEASSSTQRVPPSTPSYGSPPPACTGCVIQAHAPLTYAFAEAESSSWTSVVKTETVLSKTISYFTGTPAALQTVVTEVKTLSQTALLTGASDEIITHTTPVFTVEPTPGVKLELPAGTYLFYDKIYGGLEHLIPETTKSIDTVTYSVSHPVPTASGYVPFLHKKSAIEPTCVAPVEPLQGIMPTRTEDWRHFYQPITGTMPLMDGTTPEALPPALLKYLNQDPNVRSAFGGYNLSLCTPVMPPYPITSSSAEIATSAIPERPPPSDVTTRTSTHPTSTYIRTTYQTTSTHLTVQGCLRCDTPHGTPPVQTRKQDAAGDKKGSAVYLTAPPPYTVKPNNQLPEADQAVSIGDGKFPIYIGKPAKPGQGYSPGQDVVVGTHTLTAGQTTTINNVLVAVPTTGGGTIVVVGTNTYQILPTEAPILAFDEQMITATVIGGTTQFIAGPGQTLLPGSDLIISGTTYSMPSDVSGRVVVVINGVTSTLGLTLGLALLTTAPDITIAGTTYTATVHDGITEYVLAPGTTLKPGDAITISGTIYSLDTGNTALTVNGHTSTITKGPASNSASPTSSTSVTAPSDASFVETGGSTSSKGAAVSTRRAGLDIWIERLVIGLASWTVLLL